MLEFCLPIYWEYVVSELIEPDCNSAGKQTCCNHVINFNTLSTYVRLGWNFVVEVSKRVSLKSKFFFFLVWIVNNTEIFCITKKLKSHIFTILQIFKEIETCVDCNTYITFQKTAYLNWSLMMLILLILRFSWRKQHQCWRKQNPSRNYQRLKLATRGGWMLHWLMKLVSGVKMYDCYDFEITYTDFLWKNSWPVIFFLCEICPVLELCPFEKLKMKSYQQDISKSIWARGLQLGQLLDGDEEITCLTSEQIPWFFSRVMAFCKFWHLNLSARYLKNCLS